MTGDRLRIAIPADAGYGYYFETLTALGAEPVPVGADVDPAAFDGLLTPGGTDIDPARYHRPNTASEDIDPALDARQLAALDAFVRAGKPVFGICRGHQLINVYFGGTLIQHLPTAAVHSRCGDPWDKAHGSTAVPGGLMEALYGPAFPVNSAHHQAVETVGRGLIVDQYSDDGVIEALRHGTLPIFSVQWHPERMCLERAREDAVDGSVVLRHFLSMCAEHGKRCR